MRHASLPIAATIFLLGTAASFSAHAEPKAAAPRLESTYVTAEKIPIATVRLPRFTGDIKSQAVLAICIGGEASSGVREDLTNGAGRVTSSPFVWVSHKHSTFSNVYLSCLHEGAYYYPIRAICTVPGDNVFRIRPPGHSAAARYFVCSPNPPVLRQHSTENAVAAPTPEPAPALLTDQAATEE